MKVNAVGKILSEVERAYIAGFVDADGAIMATIEKHNEKKFRFRVRVTMKITQKDKHCLLWFQKKTNFGWIQQNRNVFDWITKDQKSIYMILENILPYLRNKRQQAIIARRIIRKNVNSLSDLVLRARLADALSLLNVRSKNRRKNFAAMIQESISRND